LSLPSGIPGGTYLKPLTVLAVNAINPSYTDTAIKTVSTVDTALSILQSFHGPLKESLGEGVGTGTLIATFVNGMALNVKRDTMQGGTSFLASFAGLDKASSHCVSSLLTDHVAGVVSRWWNAPVPSGVEPDLEKRIREINDPDKYRFRGEEQERWEHTHDQFFLRASTRADPILVAELSIGVLQKEFPLVNSLVTGLESQCSWLNNIFNSACGAAGWGGKTDEKDSSRQGT
jgi:hypothetical protein